MTYPLRVTPLLDMCTCRVSACSYWHPADVLLTAELGFVLNKLPDRPCGLFERASHLPTPEHDSSAWYVLHGVPSC